MTLNTKFVCLLHALCTGWSTLETHNLEICIPIFRQLTPTSADKANSNQTEWDKLQISHHGLLGALPYSSTIKVLQDYQMFDTILILLEWR